MGYVVLPRTVALWCLQFSCYPQSEAEMAQEEEATLIVIGRRGTITSGAETTISGRVFGYWG